LKANQVLEEEEKKEKKIDLPSERSGKRTELRAKKEKAKKRERAAGRKH
jgi:hypothetical protein